MGTAEILDAFAALAAVPWADPADFREALAATIAKSQEDRRVFELLFERFFFRAAEAEALEREIREERRYEGGEQLDLDQLREAIRQAIAQRHDGEMRDAARLAIAAFGRRGQGSGVLGVDVQRIRRSLGLKSEPGGPVREDRAEPRPEPLTRDQIRRFELHLRRELERMQIERTQALPPSRPLNELDRALPSGPLQDLAAVHRVVTQLKRRLATGLSVASSSGHHPRDLLERISEFTHDLMLRQTACFQNSVAPALREVGIRIVRWNDLDAAEREQLVTLLGKLAAAHGLAEGVHPGYRTA